ncbi:MAG TPA: Minf_1886 family protein [Gemmata sp.]|nr:Minf_1886 family protein [Gemmata sp.]
MDPRILELCRESPHFAYEAYEFVCEAVTFTMKRLGRGSVEIVPATPDQHVSGAELLRGVCDLAIREFGMMAPVVFKQWGIRTTDDIGTMVFKLINVELLSRSDRDAPEDFHELFDLHRTLAESFELMLDGGQAAKRSER